MSFAVMHKWVAYLLSGLGLFALSLGHELSTPMVAFTFVAFVGSYFVEGAVLHRPLYSRVWTGVVVVFLLVQVARAVLVEASLSLALEFAAVLQLSRLYSRRTAQDYHQIAVLAFLHLIAATVLSTELTYALVFVGFVIATPWMLALSHLRREIEANYPAFNDDDGKSHAALTRVLASRRVVGGGFLLATALLAVPLFVMTLAIFLLVPRVGQGFLSFGRGHGDKVAGFGTRVELGGFGVIRDDPTVVLRVTPEVPPQEGQPAGALRLRGTSFDHYDGRVWTRTVPGSENLRPSHGRRFVLQRVPRASDQRLHIVLDHLEQPVVFIPLGTVALEVDPKVARSQHIPRRIQHSSGYDIRYTDPDQAGLIYDVYVSRDPTEHSIVPLMDEDLGDYLQVPPGHSEVAELARTLTNNASSSYEKAARIRTYLQSERFAYSLAQPQVESGEAPLHAFLFRERTGHCEYFSTAMAIMLRTLGIPTRNVNGFAGGQYNPYGEYYALRQGDAHSWVEAFIDGHGWVTFDPTPLATAAEAAEESLWSDLNALVDALRVRWSASVVGYDLRAQMRLLLHLQRLFANTGPSLRGQGAKGPAGGWAAWVPVALLCLVLAAVATVLYRRWRRARFRGRHREPLPQELAEIVKLYGDLERVLQRRGLARPPSVTPLEHAQALAEQGFEASDVVALVTQTYVDARYGELVLGRQRLTELRQAVAALDV